MTTYLDSSVLLRHILRQPGALETEALGRTVSSDLLPVECRRALDNARLQGGLEFGEQARLAELAETLIACVALQQIDARVLARAGAPLPVPLRTLDAIHLASSLAWRERVGEPFQLATHDTRLALAARGFGLAVVGC